MYQVEIDKRNVVKCALSHLVAELVDARRHVVINGDFVEINVEEFQDFLRAYWRTCCLMSRSDEGRFVSMPLCLRVLCNGRWYRTKVWCDVEDKCLRYGSLC